MKRLARDSILSRLRSALPESAALPELPAVGPWQTFADPIQRFQEVLHSVGGQLVRATSIADAERSLRELEPWRQARRRYSAVTGLGDSHFELDRIDDPHELANVDFAILQGDFGVAENGAIWVTDSGMKQRVLFFIPQHLALVVPSNQIVHNLHEAYGRIRVGQHPFACFISGPSKTADIEQSLVIGAHGARSLTVFLITATAGAEPGAAERSGIRMVSPLAAAE